MTICIAATCADQKAVVAASDRMVSAPFLTLEFDHPDAKIDQLSRTCVGLTAGDALVATDLFTGFEGMVSQLQDPGVLLIAEHVKQRFVEVRQKLIDERVFRPRGISFVDFYSKGLVSALPPDLAMILDNQAQEGQLQASVIVAGVDGSGSHIHGIEDPGTSSCFDRLGYHAIGSGYRHALLYLATTQQHWSSSVNQTVHNVYEAKKQAELAQGVGNTTEMRVITERGVRALTQSDLNALEELHELRTVPASDCLKNKIDKLPFEGVSNAG